MFPKNCEEWLEEPGHKLDALVDILKHHLGRQNAPPLELEQNGDWTEKPNPPARDPEVDVHPDQIVVYSYFTMHWDIICNVSYLPFVVICVFTDHY